jgi:putative solute:sodium symporter small subunit
MRSAERRRAYWRANLRYLAILLAIWFAVSFGCGILFVDWLDQVRVGGFKLGFWFAQQGAIYTFVLLIVIYVRLMNRLDRRLLRDESARDAAVEPEEAP